MSKINTNMAGVTALYHLRNKEEDMNKSLERIASGLRLNHALDDAAGASIVNRMTSQIKGLEAAVRNAADAISLTQTAEGALDEVSKILHRLRELAVQAANGVYTGQDRIALNNEISQLQLELERIAENSTFNDVKIINGDFVNTTFQVGFKPNDTAILSIEDVKPTGLGEYTVSTDQSTNASATYRPAASPVLHTSKSNITARIQEAEDLTIYGNVGTATIDIDGGMSAKEVAAAVTNVMSTTGVSADAVTRLNVTFPVTSSHTTATNDTVSFNLYGKNTSAVKVSANVDFGVHNGRSTDLQSLADAVNGASGKTGVTATLNEAKTQMTLISEAGYDITMEDIAYVSLSTPNLRVASATETNADVSNTDIELTPGASSGLDTIQVSGTVTFRSPFIYSVASGRVGTAETVNFMTPTAPAESGGSPGYTAGTYYVGPIEAATTGIDTGGSGNTGISGTGMTLKVTVSTTAVTAVEILNAGSGYKYGNTFRIDESAFGGTAGQKVQLEFNEATGKSTGDTITNPGALFSGAPSAASLSAISDMDVLTVLGSKKMLTAVDGALVRIDLERSDLGATMSRMEHTINNLSNITVNTKAARSRIQDADIAAETTELTKAQVLNQAAQAMLAQANRSSQTILGLLQNL